MENENLSGTIGALIEDAISFDVEAREPKRVRALEYLRGVMNDTPADPHGSSVTTSEVADTIGWIMPGLMRIFYGSAGVVSYQANSPEREAEARQASDYVPHMFESECDGYRVMWSWFHDALTAGNGIVKYWYEWDDQTEEATFEGLNEDQVSALLEDGKTEVLGHNIGEDGTYMLRIRRAERTGKLCVANVPPEDFLIDRNARTLDDAVFVAHRARKTRSQLVEMGYSKEEIYDLPRHASYETGATETARSGFARDEMSNVPSSADLVEYFECYARIDTNDDGVAELVQVCAAGSASAPKILRAEPWDDDEAPFADLTPEIVPHTWVGRSLAEQTWDIQRINTALSRQTLDNIYRTNRPQRAVRVDAIENPQEVLDQRIGGVVRIKSGVDPRAAVSDLVVPFTAGSSISIMQYMQGVLQRRTGSTQAGVALDGEALTPQTATAKQIEHDSGYAKQELIARTFAETGVKRLFRGLLRLIIKNQDRLKTLRIRGEWVDFDPRDWDDGMPVTINVGLGTGTRERDLSMLRAVALEQDKVLQLLGPQNPVVPVSKWVATRHRMVSAAGLRDPDEYFVPVTDEQFSQFMAEKAQSAPPDPKAQQVQAKAQADMMKLQMDQQHKGNQLQANVALKQQEMQQEAQLAVLDMAMGRHGEGVTNIRGAGGV